MPATNNMSSDNATLPAAPPVIATPVPGAASPAAHSPAPAGLSTEVMSDRIREQLTGVKPAPQTPAVSGSEPSPGTPGSSTDLTETVPPPSPDNAPALDVPDDDDDASDTGLTPQALAALSQARKSKREAKAKSATLEAENRLLKEQLAAKDQPADPDAPRKAPTHVPPELAAAEQAEAEQEGLRDWARSQTETLNEALREGDPDAVLQTMRDQVARHGVTLASDPKAVLGWLKGLEKDAGHRLEKARVESTVRRQQAAQEAQALHAESRQLASEWAPQMAQTGSEASKRADLIRAQFPGLENHPMGPRFLAAAVRGWEVITTEIATKTGKPAPPRTVNGKPVMLPARPTAQLPGAASAMPARPAEGGESSTSLFAKMVKATTEGEREQLKQEWMKAALHGH